MAKIKAVRTRQRGKTFSYIFEAGRNENGKRIVIEKGGFKTRTEAYENGVEAFIRFKHGNISITSEKATFKSFADQWLENIAKVNVRPSTYALYARTLSMRIYPHIGSMQITKITPAICDRFIRQLTAAGLARNTILSAKRITHQIFSYAVYPAQLIIANPIEHIKIPVNAPREVVKRTVISPSLYEQILKAEPMGKVSHIPIIILYHTGMRIGEVMGLSWQDIDFKNKTIRIRRQYGYIPKIGYMLTPLKTASSNRNIIVDDELLMELSHWRKMQRDNADNLGSSYCVIDELPSHALEISSRCLNPHPANQFDMVCTRENGMPINRSTVMAALKKFGVNAHSFRHTHATLLIENNASPKGVAARLGHKNVDLTENLYTHYTEKMAQDTLAAFSKLMQTNT